MKKALSFILSGLVTLTLALPSYADIKVSRASKVGFSKDRLSLITPAMQKYTDQNRLAGTVTLVARNGKVVHFAETGFQDREKQQAMSKDSIFRIYSMTKPITATAALILWEQGKFHMNDPITKYLPELDGMQVYVSGEGDNAVYEPMKSKINIMDLFLHTSGFSYGFTNSEVDKQYKNSTLFSGKVAKKDMLAAIAELPLNHQPGTAWNYSISTDVLGLVVEKISGKSLADFMQDNIFGPLNMKDTGFFVPKASLNRFAQVYTVNPKTGQSVPFENEPLGDFTNLPEAQSGGGGLVSTMQDYYIFSQMLLNGGVYKGTRILGRKTVEYMRSNHMPKSLIPYSNDAQGEGYGLAMSVTLDTAPSNYLASVGDYGWAGMASTFFRIDPKENMIIISMAQFIPFGFHPYHHDFRNLAYQALVD